MEVHAAEVVMDESSAQKAFAAFHLNAEFIDISKTDFVR